MSSEPVYSTPVYSTYPEYNTDFVAPLITTFVPPASCLQDLYDNNGAFTPLLGLITNSECYPPNFSSASAKTPWRVFCGYYSPAVCPSGYSIACTEYSSFLKTGETGRICCPSNYHCLGKDVARMCTSTISEETIVTVVTDTITTAEDNVIATTTSLIPSSELPMAAWASPIRIRWREADLSIVNEPVSAQPSPGSTGIPIIPTSTLETSTSSHTSGPDRLPASTKITIGVTLPVIAIVVMALVVVLSWRRRQHKNEKKPSMGLGIYTRDSTKSELHTQQTFSSYDLEGKGSIAVELHSRPELAMIDRARMGRHDSGSGELQSRRNEEKVSTPTSPTSPAGTVGANSARRYSATSTIKRKPLPRAGTGFGAHTGSLRTTEDGSQTDFGDEEIREILPG